jgi:hypothetical protein
MGLKHHPRVVTNGLVMYLDAANTRSYSGSGNTVYNIAISSAIGGTISAGISYTSVNPQTFIAPSDGNYLLSDYTLASGTSFTVCMWFRRQATTYWSALFGNEVWSSSTGYVAMFTGPTSLTFTRGGGSSAIVYSNAGFASSNFNFYAFVKNPSGTNSVIYINGIEATSGSITDVTPTKPFVFNSRWENNGVSPSAGDSKQNQFSNIAVYNRALTALEVLQNYNATKKRYL